LLLAVVAACRHRITPYPPTAPHGAPWGLNRELLLPETTSTIVFLVEVSEGREPKSEALDSLARIASKYGERPAYWLSLSDPSAPGVVWEQPQDTRGHLGRITCPEGPLDPATSYVFVRYVGESWDAYGQAVAILASAECGRAEFPALAIAQGLLDERRILWLTRRQIEERTLLHEYGHILGLGTNPAHGYWPSVLPYDGGGHCVNPSCALVLPDTKTIAYGVYRTGLTFRQVHDYCKDCRRDIEWAKRHWRTGELFPEAERLPQPDPSITIMRLEDSDFTMGGRATALITVGKAAVPALMERLRTLPGGGTESPRAFADWVIKQILVDASDSRLGERRTAFFTEDGSAKLLEWWSREGQRFMEGDGWEIPEGAITVLPDTEHE
jgi:hypothetical protein